MFLLGSEQQDKMWWKSSRVGVWGRWGAALVAPAGVWALLHPAALWPSKGKLRVSQLQGKLSFATECEIQTKHCYPRIYPFPSTRHSCGSAFTSLALVADSSQKHKPPLSVVLLPTALSYTRRLTEPQVPFCALQWGIPSLRARAGVLLCRGPHWGKVSALCQFPKSQHGTLSRC